MDPFFPELLRELPALLSGIRWTLVLTGAITASGLLGGIVLLYFLTHPSRLLRAAANAYVTFFIGTPLLALLFLFYYGLPSLGLHPSPFATAFWGFSLNISAYNARYLLGGCRAISPTEHTAAAALGLHRRQIFASLLLPQSLRHALPALTVQAVTNLKDSSIAFLIQFDGFLSFIQNFTAQNFMFFRGYLFAAAGYLVLVALLAAASRSLQRRLRLPGFA